MLEPGARTGDLGSETTLYCPFTGDPPAYIRWAFKGEDECSRKAEVDRELYIVFNLLAR